MMQEVKPGSDRSFGIVFAIFFGIVGAYPLLSGASPRIWAWIAAGGFAVLAGVAPRVLHPANVAWFHFGRLIGKILQPILFPLVMGIVYYVGLVPFALVTQIFRKDPLKRKFDSNARSYWVERTPPGPREGSLARQF